MPSMTVSCKNDNQFRDALTVQNLQRCGFPDVDDGSLLFGHGGSQIG